MVLGVVLFAAILAICFLPAVWAKRVLRYNSGARSDIPGTGGELARHLLDQLNMPDVGVEEAQGIGDHYDPSDKAVRLERENLDGRSLTAVVVAAHEVGHAIQDRDDDPRLRARTSLAQVVARTERIGVAAMVLSPVTGLLSGMPGLTILLFVAGFLSVLATTILHLITLPVEWDASFNKAMPILAEGGYLRADDLPQADQILKACAFTYVAASLSSLLNITSWLRILLR